MELLAKAESDKHSLIRECWSSEPELYERWHYLAGEGLEACTNATFLDVKDLPNYELYRVVLEDKTIGMFGVEDSFFLTGFFIKPEFRKKEFVAEYMKLVNAKLEKTWQVVLYERNTRAIDFFKKNGAFEVVRIPHKDQRVVVLQMSSGEL